MTTSNQTTQDVLTERVGLPCIAKGWLPPLALLLLLTSCATPVAPTGGPRDEQPPRLIHSEPKTGTTRYQGDRLIFTFDEYVNRSTFDQALRIEPDLKIPTRTEWKKTTATVEFLSALPENTTLIATLGTELKDMRGNGLKKPIRIAFSTGDEIDDGTIQVQVLDALTAAQQAGRSVFLYPEPYDTRNPAKYVSQTDTAGIATFIALAEGRYRPIWVDDRNRNRRWEPDREPAQPFDAPFVELRQEGEESVAGGSEEVEMKIPQVYVIQTDTVSPDLQGVGLLSQTRLRLRFSEPMRIIRSETSPDPIPSAPESAPDSSAIQASQNASPGVLPLTIWRGEGEPSHRSVQDSTEYTFDVIPLYVLPEDPSVVIAQSLKPLETGWTYRFTTLQPPTLQDVSGNAWDPINTAPDPFPGTATSDTTFLDLLPGVVLPADLYPDEALAIAFNQLIDSSAISDRSKPFLQTILDSTQVILGTQRIKPWPLIKRQENRLLLFPTPEFGGTWPDTPAPEFQLYDPFTRTYQSIKPSILTPMKLGDLEITISLQGLDNEAPIVLRIELLPELAGLTPSRPTASTTTPSPPVWTHQLSLNPPDEGDSTPDQTHTLTSPLLRPGLYTLIVYHDRNADGAWNAGRVEPFILPEPIRIQPGVPVIGGLTGTVEVRFRVGSAE